MKAKITTFKDIPINRDEISQSLLNIDEKVRSNLFTWNGQFSPQFIEALLRKYAHEDFFVIDPFAGSGTTLAECARQNISAYGIELNVSAYYMAKTYELVNFAQPRRKEYIDSISSFVRSIQHDDEIINSLTEKIRSENDSTTANILSTLIVFMDIYKNDVNRELLYKKWDFLSNIILNLPYSKALIHADRGDARKMDVVTGSADLLITSPPYINVFNYHQKYRRSVEALGYNVLIIAKSEFGSNRKNRGNRLLTVIQYCIDMAESIQEAIRACKDDARMIYVVGRESTVLGYSFCNSELIYNICTRIFDLPFLIRQERVFKNRFGQMIYEDILHFSNVNNTRTIDKFLIDEEARKIAVEMLSSKEEQENKNKDLLEEAISKSANVKESIKA